MAFKPSQTLLAGLGLVFTFFLVQALLHRGTNAASQWGQWLILPGVLMAVVYVLSPQVNWWWYKRKTPLLSPPAAHFVAQVVPFYHHLAPEGQIEFQKRLNLFTIGTQFIAPQNNESGVPEDLKWLIGSLFVQVFWGKPQQFVSDYENIVVYPHPFPTPQYEAFHTSEIYTPDNVILLAADTLSQGFQQPQQFFSIGLYEFSRVFRYTFPQTTYPNLTDADWPLLETISQQPLHLISRIIGLEDIDIWGVASHHFFAFPERFAEIWPEMYATMCQIFQQDPRQRTQPRLA